MIEWIAVHVSSQDHIFAPLGITSASFCLTPPLKNRLLPLSFRSESGIIKRWKGPSVIEQDPAHGK
jgi:CubicO group peptidase (beta-lactamase class C family)